MKSTLLFLAVAISTQAASFENETSMEFHERQTRLISHLFSGYRKDVPPISTRGRYSSVTINPMVVNITLAYAKLLSVNEPNQLVDMIVEYNLASLFYRYNLTLKNKWNDARLTWNPADFDEIKGFLINRELIWRVDLMPYDSSSVVDIRDPDVQHAYVNSNGDIEFYVASVVSYSCPLNVKAFPFDKQVCEVNFASYNFGSSELQINADILKNYNGIGAFIKCAFIAQDHYHSN
ncbi:unnamed protein product [Cylicocyclus nassatus]|uniref:Neurotransmitter-gated ion-channel ligand-binding domain-containing protein n=1 Tax=Cylicocyclus nassatus TaxID=53992 RepID=A0AA36GSV2_CYLNA|nr:unnamed protein product [Cylicocyclus nassatus]